MKVVELKTISFELPENIVKFIEELVIKESTTYRYPNIEPRERGLLEIINLYLSEFSSSEEDERFDKILQENGVKLY